MQHSTLAIALVAALVGWRVVMRVRRLVGRQSLRLWRVRATVLVFPFLLGLLFVGALGETEALGAIALGTAAGAALAWIGLRRTRLEITDDGGCFYTPFAPIGIGLALLLIGRLVYRGLELYEARAAGSADAASFALTPPTLFVFATLAGYYGAFSFGLLRWHARLPRR